MNVFWSSRAKRHLRSIHDYIAADSLEAAQKVVDNTTSRSKQIAAFPLSGRVVQHLLDDSIREIIEGNY